ncbi:hypothetical protein M2419_002061 [Sphingobacterium sp. BIGb0116]|nr:hypothetical protein [Sphingobacterium sp. BIGb0116]
MFKTLVIQYLGNLFFARSNHEAVSPLRHIEQYPNTA